MTEDKKKELQSAAFERLLHHLDERKDVQNIDLMNLAGFCRNCISRWYREEAEKKNITISDLEAREHVYGILLGFAGIVYQDGIEKRLKKKILLLVILRLVNMFMVCPIQSGKKNIKNNYFSLSLGNSSTKLQGL